MRCLLTLKQKLRLNVTESRGSSCLMRTLPRSRRFLNKLDDPFQTGGVSDSIFSNSCRNEKETPIGSFICKIRGQTRRTAVFGGGFTRGVLTFLVRVFSALLPGERTRGNKAKQKKVSNSQSLNNKERLTSNKIFKGTSRLLEKIVPGSKSENRHL